MVGCTLIAQQRCRCVCVLSVVASTRLIVSSIVETAFVVDTEDRYFPHLAPMTISDTTSFTCSYVGINSLVGLAIGHGSLMPVVHAITLPRAKGYRLHVPVNV